MVLCPSITSWFLILEWDPPIIFDMEHPPVFGQCINIVFIVVFISLLEYHNKMTPKNKNIKIIDNYFANYLSEKNNEKIDMFGLKQFTTNDYKRFYPAFSTVPVLVPGIYDIEIDSMKGLYFHKIDVKTDGLIRFPETNSEKVIEEISKFWEREDIFNKYKLNYKRGIFLYGPAGSGKSSTIQLICEDVIKREGVVFKFSNPGLFCDGIRTFREIQPKTPVVVLMEDIDSIIDCNNESEILNILDGVDQVEKVVYLATTNPEVSFPHPYIDFRFNTLFEFALSLITKYYFFNITNKFKIYALWTSSWY